MEPRVRWENLEKTLLAPEACRSVESRGRERLEPPCPLRTAFQRDRDRILHSKAFRRLKHKTHAVLLPEGDHYRTRLTHTLEVSQIARTISRALRLNEDLAEAVALGHDLGHTPFGHMGERSLHRLAREHGLGGFHHALQSLRIVTLLERDGRGLNLTWEVRDGIVHHSKGQVDLREGFAAGLPATLEGAVVRISDALAYLNHDLDDALRGGLVRDIDLPEDVRRIGQTHGERLGAMVGDVVAQSTPDRIALSPEMLGVVEALRRFLFDRVYNGESARSEEPKVDALLRTLAEALWERRLPWRDEPFGTYEEVLDFISGMSDRYALTLFEKVAIPSAWPVEGVANLRWQK